jgi:hypothetical protein
MRTRDYKQLLHAKVQRLLHHPACPVCDINHLDHKRACPRLRSHLKIVQDQPDGGPQGVMLTGLLVERGVCLIELLQASACHHLLTKLFIKHYSNTHQQRQKAY